MERAKERQAFIEKANVLLELETGLCILRVWECMCICVCMYMYVKVYIVHACRQGRDLLC